MKKFNPFSRNEIGNKTLTAKKSEMRKITIIKVIRVAVPKPKPHGQARGQDTTVSQCSVDLLQIQASTKF